ncbi:DUF6793 family protein [Shewanella sp. UCD-KL12]|uniref:DUF6793 family protein n=1 Tax=Shewanella sp. UCD-KL12 TaxID=1917163 RepID=UPI000971369A|nr:DUF6793 family protein [Shewanella sp. UCD-KL12]
MEEALIIFAVLASVFIYSELVTAKRKINRLERKIDTLLKNNGIIYDDKLHISKEVLSSIAAGHKLKAIRLYQEETGVGLKKAQEVINRLV